ncbi:MAG: hypothetical protein IKW28_08180, partial [Lachnospiraceae bacterium]|nr:hypothetical protein [Lachnospiraceae bacterium]
GMDAFKKETMKLTVQNIIDTAVSFDKDTNISLHGAMGLRTAPSVLIRTLMGVFFGAHLGGKNKEYHQNDEYNTENMSWNEFYGEANRRNFNDKLWNVFDAMIEASGEEGDTVEQRRESVWKKMEKLSYIKDRPEEEKRIIKDMFIRGRTAMYGMWNLKDE